MKEKLNSMSETGFLKLVFAFFSAAFLIAALCMPDRKDMFSGFLTILSSPCKVSTNYFALGGYSATFLNAGLVGLICLAVYHFSGAKLSHVSTLAFLLTLGFCTWGINVLNILPTMLGVVLYCLVKKETLAANANAVLFSTGIAPLISELMVRYPNPEAAGFTPVGVILALIVGIGIGFFLPAGLVHSPNVHKGFDLYNAAVPVGMTAFFLQALLHKTLGVDIPAAPAGETLQIASPLIVNVFCCVVFGLCVLASLWLGGTPKDYIAMLRDPQLHTSVADRHGKEIFLMNLGIYGLFILAYYNLIGASFNGVTFGVIFCMLACCNAGSTPATVLPIMLGYVAASWIARWTSGVAGGTFAGAINAQAIVVGLCYANGLSPISRKYGWPFAFLAAMMHYTMVTTVPSLHGGYCLYNGGFTAALVCLLLIPILERFVPQRKLGA